MSVLVLFQLTNGWWSLKNNFSNVLFSWNKQTFSYFWIFGRHCQQLLLLLLGRPAWALDSGSWHRLERKRWLPTQHMTLFFWILKKNGTTLSHFDSTAFSPRLPDFSRGEKRGKIWYLSEKIRWKIPIFPLSIQLRRGTLAYFYARFYVGTRTFPRPPPSRSGQAPAPIQVRPAMQARPSRPAPALQARSGPAVRHLLQNFSLAQKPFFPGHTGFFPRVRGRRKNSVQTEKTHLLHWSDLSCSAAERDISRFFPRIDRIFSGEALNPFFGAQDKGFSEFRSR